MIRILLILAITLIFSACTSKESSLSGTYSLEISGAKNIRNGTIDLIGESGDYFGKITLFGQRERVYEIGLSKETSDSLLFIMPGNGGFLHIDKSDSTWSGKFKYFGIQADIKANKSGPISPELGALAKLSPLAKDIISTSGEESFPSFDPSSNTLYFCRDQKIFSSVYTNKAWSLPELLPHSEGFNNSAPYVFNGGKSLLFTSNRQLDSTEHKKKNLWTMNQIDGKWSYPKPLPSPINVDSLGDYHGAISNDETIYFVSFNRPDGSGRSDLYMAKQRNSQSYFVSNLGYQINSEKSEADVFVDPNERYLLFASTDREDSYGADDIYISFRDGDSWSTPQNLGSKVNSYAYEYGAWVDHENGYLYFNSYRRGTSDIYRVELDDLEVFNDL